MQRYIVMKKTSYFNRLTFRASRIFAVSAICLFFISCDEDDDPNLNIPTEYVRLLRQFVSLCEAKPEMLHVSELEFFREWLAK